MWRGVIAGLALCFAAAACGREEDPLEGLAAGERGRVVRVLDGDALVLDTGQSVRLVSIEAPAAPYRDRDGEAGFETAKRMLEDMALGREVELRYAGLTRDRYDRALAHVVTADALGPELWLNAEMVRRGGARVRIYADTALGAETLLVDEANARADGAGLWGKDTWPIPAAENLPADFTRFQIVEAISGRMIGAQGYGAVCELSLAGSPLALEIKTAAAELCQLPEGIPIRARGFVRDKRMEIAHPLNVERRGDP